MRNSLVPGLVVLGLFVCVGAPACNSTAVGKERDPNEPDAAASAAPTTPATAAPTRLVVPTTISAGCRAFAAGSCERDARCAPFFFPFLYGDKTFCEETVAVRCAVAQSAPGAAPVPVTCGADIARETCENHAPVPSCIPPGALPNGSRCNFPSQCQSRTCRLASSGDPTCGTCTGPEDPTPPRPFRGNGALCDLTKFCSPGYDCHRGVCRSFFLGPDDECSQIDPCPAGRECVRGACVLALGLGAPCTTAGGGDACDISQHLRCETGTDPNLNGTCQKTALPPDLGEPCTNTWTACRGNASCTGTSATSTRVCSPRLPDGASCVAPGSRCAGAYSTCDNGICRAVGPVLCE